MAPEGASRCRAVASGLADRSADHYSSSWRERAEPMDGAWRSQGRQDEDEDGADKGRCAPSPRAAQRSGERVGVRGVFSARPPHPIPDVATTEPPSPRKRGEGAITTTARVVTSHHFSHSLSRSRGAILRPGFAFGFAHPNFGVAERRETFRCLRGTGWACTIGAGQAPSEAPRVPIPALRPDRSQRTPRIRVVVPGGGAPASRGDGCESPPRDATPRSAFRMPPDDAPRRARMRIFTLRHIW
jgi:hypothetical protein